MGKLSEYGSIFGGVGQAIGAVGDIVGGIISGDWTSYKKRKRRAHQEAEYQAGLQRDMLDYQLEKQWEYEQKAFQMENEYNSPAAQVQRLKEAGLSPALMYENGGGSIAGSMSGVSGSPTSASYPVPEQSSPSSPDFSGLGSIGTVLAQIDQMKANTRLTNANAERIERENAARDDTWYQTVADAFERKEAAGAISAENAAKMSGIALDVATANKEFDMKRSEATYNNLVAQTNKANKEVETLDVTMEEKRSQIMLNYGRFYESIASALNLEAMTKTEDVMRFTPEQAMQYNEAIVSKLTSESYLAQYDETERRIINDVVLDMQDDIKEAKKNNILAALNESDVDSSGFAKACAWIERGAQALSPIFSFGTSINVNKSYRSDGNGSRSRRRR